MTWILWEENLRAPGVTGASLEGRVGSVLVSAAGGRFSRAWLPSPRPLPLPGAHVVQRFAIGHGNAVPAGVAALRSNQLPYKFVLIEKQKMLRLNRSIHVLKMIICLSHRA
ncbi:hypothetical protein ABID49_002144 [Bhargavaea ullalensis]|uniref:Uncharacterized protein n=1 Tax=Bhargavaea ullalensis TaxID=1265685 RepID=A0ABV2GD62_9BACL